MEQVSGGRLALATVILTAVAVAYLLLTSPGGVVLDRHGSVEGIANYVRSALQGKRFWRDQKEHLERELQLRLRETQLRAVQERFEARLSAPTTPNLAESPRGDLPSAEALEALELRLGNEIEQAGMERLREENRLERISELEVLLSLVETRSR